MDQLVVEIPEGVAAKAGDIVSVLGGVLESGAPSIAQIAAMMDTNAYEVLVGIRQRIPRVFTRGNVDVAVRSLGVESPAQW